MRRITSTVIMGACVVLIAILANIIADATRTDYSHPKLPPLGATAKVVPGGVPGPARPSVCGAALCDPVSAKHPRLTPLDRAQLFGIGHNAPDLSNNDPAYNQQAIRNHGHTEEWLKLNQGTGYIDRTAAAMAAAALRAGINVTGYDFLEPCRTGAEDEARLFVSRLRALGLLHDGAMRPAGDAEAYGCGSAVGNQRWIQSWVNEVHRLTGVWPGMYTGAWWWNPNVGCWWPAPRSEVYPWISGYNVRAPYMPCSTSLSDLVWWQFTDKGYNGAVTGDMSVARKDVPTIGPPPVPSAVVAQCSQVEKLWARRDRQHGLHKYGHRRLEDLYDAVGQAHYNCHTDEARPSAPLDAWHLRDCAILQNKWRANRHGRYTHGIIRHLRRWGVRCHLPPVGAVRIALVTR